MKWLPVLLASLFACSPVGPEPCAPPLQAGDASWGGEYDIASRELQIDSVTVSVWYPARAHSPGGGIMLGSDVPFARGLRRVPVVFMAHGSGGLTSGRAYLGYQYLQAALARHGIVAASMRDASGILSPSREAVRTTVEHFARLNADPSSFVYGLLDLTNVGMMAHSSAWDAITSLKQDPPLGVEVRAILMLATGSSTSLLSGVDGFMTILPAAEGGGYPPPGYPDVPGAMDYDFLGPSPLKVQLYVQRANHYSWNRSVPTPDTLSTATPPIFSDKHHELILRSYGTAFFLGVLRYLSRTPDRQRGELASRIGPLAYLTGRRLPVLESPAVPSAGVYGETVVDPANLILSFKTEFALTVDDHEQTDGLVSNSLGAPTSSGVVVEERQCTPGISCNQYAGSTRLLMMTAACASGAPLASCPDASFRTELRASAGDLRGRTAILVRAGEPLIGVVNGVQAIAATGVGFAIGVEDAAGNVRWVDASAVGGVPRPYARNDIYQRWVMKTLRFPLSCFNALDLTGVRALHLKPAGMAASRQIAFDDLQIE